MKEDVKKYVSVIIPTYNRATTIKRAVESVLKQTYKLLEVIIIDDNSSDNTDEIIKKIDDERIRYIKLEKNRGANFARNIGVELAKYEIIAFQDSDDEWHEDKLEIQMKYMQNEEIDFVATSYNQFINEKFKMVVPSIKIKDKYLERILKSNFIGTGTLVIKKEIILNEKFNIELPRLQDYELAIRLILKYKGKFLNIPKVNAYIQNNSISNNNEKLLLAMKKIVKINRKIYRKNRKLLSRKYLEIYRISMKINTYEKKYLYLSLRYNLEIKNVLFWLFDKFYLMSDLEWIKKYIRRRKNENISNSSTSR